MVIPGLLGKQLEINSNYMFQHFSNFIFTGDSCAVNGVHLLPPASITRLTEEGQNSKCYWNPEEVAPRPLR